MLIWPPFSMALTTSAYTFFGRRSFMTALLNTLEPKISGIVVIILPPFLFIQKLDETIILNLTEKIYYRYYKNSDKECPSVQLHCRWKERYTPSTTL